MQYIIDFFSYINGLGASVMMPIILTIFGVILGAKFGKAFFTERIVIPRHGYFTEKL